MNAQFIKSNPSEISKSGDFYKTKPTLDIKMGGIPKILSLYEPKLDTIVSNRFMKMIRAYKLPQNSYVMNNPFSQQYLLRFIGTNWVSYGNMSKFLLNECHDYLRVIPAPINGYARLDDGAYAIFFHESYIDREDRSIFILFDRDIFNTGDSIARFIIEFSRKIRSMKIESRFCDKEAFNSIFLPDVMMSDFRADIESFLQSRKLYTDDLNLAWKRGYMLVGPPGNGKTLLLRKICEYYGLEHFDIRKVIDQSGNISMDQEMESSIDALLFPDEILPKICVLEDIDKFTTFQSGGNDPDVGSISLHALLKGIDGVDQFDGIILIATTNFPDVLHEALVGRPGRFDKIYAIDKPVEEQILQCLQYYKINIKDGTLQDASKKLVGYSMAFVAEFVKSTKMKYKRNEITREEARVVLDAIQKHRDLCEKHFKDSIKVGFGKYD